jgi:hypothetical protein
MKPARGRRTAPAASPPVARESRTPRRTPAGGGAARGRSRADAAPDALAEARRRWEDGFAASPPRDAVRPAPV